MADAMKSNLEPIEESDLDLGKKFGAAGAEKSETPTVPSAQNVEAPTVQKVEKEIPQEVSSAEKDAAYNKILSKVQTTTQPVSNDDVKNDAQKVSEKTDADSQIQHLVDLATQKGVPYSVKVTRHLEDNYTLDQFHDKLMADELHNALLQKGLIKEM
jgi:hypothetical protein